VVARTHVALEMSLIAMSYARPLLMRRAQFAARPGNLVSQVLVRDARILANVKQRNSRLGE